MTSVIFYWIAILSMILAIVNRFYAVDLYAASWELEWAILNVLMALYWQREENK